MLIWSNYHTCETIVLQYRNTKSSELGPPEQVNLAMGGTTVRQYHLQVTQSKKTHSIVQEEFESVSEQSQWDAWEYFKMFTLFPRLKPSYKHAKLESNRRPCRYWWYNNTWVITDSLVINHTGRTGGDTSSSNKTFTLNSFLMPHI